MQTFVGINFAGLRVIGVDLALESTGNLSREVHVWSSIRNQCVRMCVLMNAVMRTKVSAVDSAQSSRDISAKDCYRLAQITAQG